MVLHYLLYSLLSIEWFPIIFSDCETFVPSLTRVYFSLKGSFLAKCPLLNSYALKKLRYSCTSIGKTLQDNKIKLKGYKIHGVPFIKFNLFWHIYIYINSCSTYCLWRKYWNYSSISHLHLDSFNINQM
jgi:hypothetical protein